MDAAGTQTALDNLEAAALSQDHVANGNSDIVEANVSVAMGRIVVAVDLEHSVNGDAGGVMGHEHNRLLAVRILVVGVRLAHDNVDVAARVASAARPPLLAVEDVLVALAANVELDVGSVGRGDLGLGHEERGANLAVHQGLEPLLLLGVVAVLGQDLHVARVGGRAVAGLGGAARAAQPLGHEAVLEVGPAGRLLVVALGQEHVPQTQLLGLFLELLDDGRVALPAGVALADLGFEDGVGTAIPRWAG